MVLAGKSMNIVLRWILLNPFLLRTSNADRLLEAIAREDNGTARAGSISLDPVPLVGT